jgi:periplasmic divalent cation tolerance protein
MKEYCVIYVTVPDEDLAEKIAESLVSKKLAACVNIIPSVKSVYSWQGKICDDKELLLMIKTMYDAFESIKKEIKLLHTYEVPEIIALPINQGSEEYLKWLKDNVIV